MPSQLPTSSNDLPMRGSITMLPLRDEWTLVTEEGSELHEAQEEASDSEKIESWQMLDEDPENHDLGTTPSQSQASSDSSSPASSTLTAPGLVDGCVSPASPSADSAADGGPALVTGPSLPPTNLELDEVDIEPATSSGPGPYIKVAFRAAKPSGAEFDSFTFRPRTTNASSLGPEPLQFGSASAIYSSGPWISPEEHSALFSQGPIFLFFEPELADGRAIAFSGATHPTSSGHSPPQSPSSELRAPEPGVSPSLDISSNQVRPGPSSNLGHEPYSVGPKIHTDGPGPSPNRPEIPPSSSSGPEPCSAMGLTFGPRPSSYNPNSDANDRVMGPRPTSPNPDSCTKQANDRMMGPRPTSPNPDSTANDRVMGPRPTSPNPDSCTKQANDRMMGPRPTFFRPHSSANDRVMEPRPTSPNPNSCTKQANDRMMGPRPTSFNPSRAHDRMVGPRPTSYSPGCYGSTPNKGPGPFSFGPGPHVYDMTIGLNAASKNTSRGPGPASFGPGPHVYDTISGLNSNTYHSIRGPGPTSFGPGLTMYTPTMGPGSILDPRAPSITVEHTSVKSDACKRFFCAPCNKGFERIEHLERHKATYSHSNHLAAEGMPLNPSLSPEVSCPLCDRTFNRKDNLRPHLLRHMDNGTRSRTRQVSVDESLRLGLAQIDPRLRINLQCRLGKWEIEDE